MARVVVIVVGVVVVVVLIGLALAVRIVTQYENGVLFRLGRVVGVKDPGLALRLAMARRHGTYELASIEPEVERRVDEVDKRFIAGEQPVAAGE